MTIISLLCGYGAGESAHQCTSRRASRNSLAQHTRVWSDLAVAIKEELENLEREYAS